MKSKVNSNIQDISLAAELKMISSRKRENQNQFNKLDTIVMEIDFSIIRIREKLMIIGVR